MKLSENAGSLEQSADSLAGKIGSGLEECAQNLPSAQTSDIHILAGESYLKKLKESDSVSEEDKLTMLWDAFHCFSQTHSTLYLQRQQQRLLRQSRGDKKKSSSKGATNPSETDTACLQLATSTEDTRRLLSSLPNGWTVVQITVGVGEEGAAARLLHLPPPRHLLYVARAVAGDDCDLHGRLVMQTLEKCDDSLLQEMERIKEQNRVLNKAYADDASKYFAMRESLENRLRGVVKGLECSWLGVWRSLLAGALPFAMQSQVLDAVDVAAISAGITLSQQQRYKLMLVVSCPCVQLNPFDDVPSISKLDQQHSLPFQLRAAVGAVLQESVRSSVVQKLCAALQDHDTCFKKARDSPRGPIVLVLDKTVVSLPWEVMSVLQHQPVTRMPSLLSLHALYTRNSSPGTSSVIKDDIDCSKGFYLLDPEGNLPRTQHRLAAAFRDTNWPGLCAEKPSHDQFKEALSSADTFMYVGHGSGSQYLPGELVEEVSCHACVMLYGCSSVRLQPRGFIPDPWGVLLNYLLANCPCVVGMLWEVTDKDTDLVTKAMIERMSAVRNGDCQEPLDLPSIVAASRPLCNRFVTASALVVYGLPCSLKVPKTVTKK